MTHEIIHDGNNPQATKKHLRNHTAWVEQSTMARCSLGAACHPADNKTGLRSCAALLGHC